MLTCKAVFEKQEHDLTFTFSLEDQPRGRLNLVVREISSAIHQGRLQRILLKEFCGNGILVRYSPLNEGGVNVSDLHRVQRMAAAWRL
jgi:hypothetical protein